MDRGSFNGIAPCGTARGFIDVRVETGAVVLEQKLNAIMRTAFGVLGIAKMEIPPT